MSKTSTTANVSADTAHHGHPKMQNHLPIRLLLIVQNAIAILLSIIGARVVLFVALCFLVPFLILNTLIFFFQTQGISISFNVSRSSGGYTRVSDFEGIDTPLSSATTATTSGTACPNKTDAEACSGTGNRMGGEDGDQTRDRARPVIFFLDVLVAIFCLVFHFVVGIISSDGWGHSVMMGLDVAMIFIICA